MHSRVSGNAGTGWNLYRGCRDGEDVLQPEEAAASFGKTEGEVRDMASKGQITEFRDGDRRSSRSTRSTSSPATPARTSPA